MRRYVGLTNYTFLSTNDKVLNFFIGQTAMNVLDVSLDHLALLIPPTAYTHYQEACLLFRKKARVEILETAFPLN